MLLQCVSEGPTPPKQRIIALDDENQKHCLKLCEEF